MYLFVCVSVSVFVSVCVLVCVCFFFMDSSKTTDKQKERSNETGKVYRKDSAKAINHNQYFAKTRYSVTKYSIYIYVRVYTKTLFVKKKKKQFFREDKMKEIYLRENEFFKLANKNHCL